MNVLVLEDAAAGLESGKKFYELRESGVGSYFAESLLSDLDSLLLYAGVHSKHFGFHRMLSKRFPFAVYYQVEGNTVLVYAILDMRRDPAWLRTEMARRRKGKAKD